ncbi:MAG: hypothetical protein KQJ78_18090 [Deltaproteobacteria bacterium]|nr:hypothetical protein [Deltaproteobacteria bacterium]
MPRGKQIPAYCLALLGLLVLGAGAAAPAQAQTTELVSRPADGAQTDHHSVSPSPSASGRWVAFTSLATNLVPGDTNGVRDVFVKDRRTGAVERVSVSSSGEEGNARSDYPNISDNGRYVAFISEAGNLRAGGLVGQYDYFVHDRQTGETTWVGPGPFTWRGVTYRWAPAISADGRYVVYATGEPNAALGDNNTWCDVYLWDRDTGATELVSVSNTGDPGDADSGEPDVSDDGRYVVFASETTNLAPGAPSGFAELLLRDRQANQTTRVSVNSAGEAANGDANTPYLSGDGGYLVYLSWATNLAGPKTVATIQVFGHDLVSGETSGISVQLDGTLNGARSYAPRVSADGRYVAFNSENANLVSGDNNNQTDVFLRDRQTATTRLVSRATDGTQSNGYNNSADISADGSTVVFDSTATNLAPDDTDGFADIYAVSPLVGNQLLMYRAYNADTLDHFFTTRAREFANAVATGYEDESTGVERRLFQVTDQALHGAHLLHRLYNPYAGLHYYTFSDAERDNLMALGWLFERDEGYIFTSLDVAPPQAIEIYHLYNTAVGVHLFTANAAEVAAVLAGIPDWQLARSLGFAYPGPGATVRDYTELPPHSSVLEAAARASGLQ